MPPGTSLAIFISLRLQLVTRRSPRPPFIQPWAKPALVVRSQADLSTDQIVKACVPKMKS
jgi:hypothetical protein